MAYEKSSTKDFFFIFLRCTFCIIKTGNTPLLFIALSLLAASAWPTCIASPPQCDLAQELLGKISLIEAVEESDVISLTTREWDGSRAVFELYYPYNYKKLRVSKEIVIDGYNNFSKVETYNVAVFLTKHNESSFQLYSQNNQELVPLEFGTKFRNPNMTAFLVCVNYLLLEEQEPEIVVNQYLQKAWDVQDKYYFETGNQVNLLCRGSNSYLPNNSVWHLPDGANFSGYNITVDQEGKYSCKFSIDDKESWSSSVTLEALGENSSILELASDDSTQEIHDMGDHTEDMEWHLDFLAYPKDVTFCWEHEGKTLNFTCESKREDKHNVDCDYKSGTLTLKLKRPSVLEAGTHSLTATIWKNGTSPLSQKTLQMQLVVLDHDLDIILSLETLEGVQIPKDQILEKTQQFYLKCKVTGHPVTDILLEFKPCGSFENCSSPSKVLDKVMVNGSSDITSTVGPKVRIWKDSAEAQGIYQCIGRNKNGENFLSNHTTVAISDYGQLAFMTLEAEVTREESEELIHVNSSSSVIEVIMGDMVLLKCRKNKMANLTDEFMWTSQDIDFHQENITKQEEEFSEVLEWRLDPDLLKYNGTKIRCLSSDERLIIVQGCNSSFRLL